MEEGPSQSSRRSTRAQLAPSWTSTETLTLLKQISAVDRDCRNTIASFQKWKMVSGNLAAAGVHRSLDQCRRKWASLLAAYTKAKELGSYWNLDDDVRAQDGVSEDFDLEVFKVMDEYLKKENEEGERENGGEETDPDVGAAGIDDDMADSLTEDHEDGSGFEKQKNHLLVCKKRSAVETVSKPMKLKEAAKKRKRPQIVPSVLSEEVDEEVNLLNEQKMLLATNHQSSEEEVGEEEDDEGQVLAEKLLESVKSVKAIVRLKLSDSDDFLTADSRDVETDFIRHQGDQLIEHLRKLARTLEQLCEVEQ